MFRSQSFITNWLFKLSTNNRQSSPELMAISLLYIEILASGAPDSTSFARVLISNSRALEPVKVAPILLIYPTNPADSSVPTYIDLIS